MRIYSSNVDLISWKLKWAWHLNLFSRTRVYLFYFVMVCHCFYGKCSQILNTTLHTVGLYSNAFVSLNISWNGKQHRAESYTFFRSCLVWICMVCIIYAIFNLKNLCEILGQLLYWKKGFHRSTSYLLLNRIKSINVSCFQFLFFSSLINIIWPLLYLWISSCFNP